MLQRHVHKPFSQLCFDTIVYLLVTVDRVTRPFSRCTSRFTPRQRMRNIHWQLACTMATQGGGGALVALTDLLAAPRCPFPFFLGSSVFFRDRCLPCAEATSKASLALLGRRHS